MILTSIAVDDEPLALNLITSYISQTPSLDLKGKFTNAVDALKYIHENPVDVVFLDIRMNDLSGIELAKVLNEYRNNGNLRVIFTTAYDQYALESYKVEALDYLMKPFSYADFAKSVTKAVKYYELLKGVSGSTEIAKETLSDETEYIYLKVEYQMVRVDVSDILYVESDKDYVKVFVKNEAKPITSLTSLKSVEEKLPKSKFMRIHRSFIVALDKIKAATKGTVEVSGRSIPVTDQYRDNYADFFKNWQ
ncbi:MAG: response regulator transcription factor [Flavobacterium sp.]|uniref:LytR/AlgR family response regulator transcription factor n=1 Tax=Flavobacterium sp. TaxID=239 RepID=UPI00120E99AD|nr:LytTR family DNA-binding domain-containing protein [Flavobacterium sp.]RZJ63376.1 MAG: response regulator transcription factor [Flavobacterium sp.]